MRSEPDAVPSLWLTARAAVAFVLLLPPLVLLLALMRDADRGGALVRRFTRWGLRIAGIDAEVRHGERIPHGGAVLVANHESLADAVVLVGLLPGAPRFVAGHQWAGYPLIGTAIRRACCHIVDRGSYRSRAECGQVMEAVVRDGTTLFVFPEGTFLDTPGLLPFRSGAFRAAARSGRPIVPLVIRGTRALLPANTFRLRRARVVVDVLDPLRPGGDTRTDVSALRDAAWQQIATALGEPTATPTDYNR